jgi:hypothetical protein
VCAVSLITRHLLISSSSNQARKRRESERRQSQAARYETIWLNPDMSNYHPRPAHRLFTSPLPQTNKFLSPSASPEPFSSLGSVSSFEFTPTASMMTSRAASPHRPFYSDHYTQRATHPAAFLASTRTSPTPGNILTPTTTRPTTPLRTEELRTTTKPRRTSTAKTSASGLTPRVNGTNLVISAAQSDGGNVGGTRIHRHDRRHFDSSHHVMASASMTSSASTETVKRIQHHQGEPQHTRSRHAEIFPAKVRIITIPNCSSPT